MQRVAKCLFKIIYKQYCKVSMNISLTCTRFRHRSHVLICTERLQFAHMRLSCNANCFINQTGQLCRFISYFSYKNTLCDTLSFVDYSQIYKKDIASSVNCDAALKLFFVNPIFLGKSCELVWKIVLFHRLLTPSIDFNQIAKRNFNKLR